MASLTETLLRYVGAGLDAREEASLSRKSFFERASSSGTTSAFMGLGTVRTGQLNTPMLQGDFALYVEGMGAAGMISEANYLIGISGGTSSGLSWSPHGSVLGVPMPSLSQQYLTLTYNVVASDTDGGYMAEMDFPTIKLYEEQFSNKGLLRLPMGGRFHGQYGVRGATEDSATLSLNTVQNSWGHPNQMSSGSVRPVRNMVLSYQPLSQAAVNFATVYLCRFKNCVFGTPQPTVNPSGVAPMGWSQQIGFQFIEWFGDVDYDFM